MSILRTFRSFARCLVATAILFTLWNTALQGAELPVEKSLWGNSLQSNPIQYPDGESVREPAAPPASPSGRNRVFSRVSEPTYTIHRPPAALANGVGIVICPGGGYVDVWLDREGHDLGLFLAARGVTSLVLKYRTNSRAADGPDGRQYGWETYLPAVVADAREAVRTLRRQAEALGLDSKKIGIAGYSAGGHLAFSAGFDRRYWGERGDVSGQANFVGLLYPWLWDGILDVARGEENAPPTFIMNGGPDRVTPAVNAVALYQVLLEQDVPSELHIFGKGDHGFDLGDGRGESAALWKVSFVAWLQDMGWIDYQR